MAATGGGGNRPPETLNESHKAMARMEAANCTDAQIAAATGYHINRVVAVRASPLYKAFLASLSKEINAQTVFDVAAEIGKLAQTAVETKRKLMERLDDHPAVANAASDSILDRVMPKRTGHDVESTVNVRLTFEDKHRIDAVLAEALDVTPTPKGLKSIAQAAADADARAREDEEAA